MQTTRRLLTFALVLSLASAACTDGGDSAAGATAGSGATGEVGPTPVISGSATSATYEYRGAGVRVTLEIEGAAGTMDVTNGSGLELGDPGFYILDARDGTRIDGLVTSPAPVPDKQRATFDISFQGIAIPDIGAIGLLFGTDNFGLLVRTA